MSFGDLSAAAAKVVAGGALKGCWKLLAAMPTPQGEGATARVNGKLYVMGGWQDRANPFPLVQVYDIAADSWSAGVPMPETLHHHAMAVIGDSIYVIGGATGPNRERVILDHVWEFNTLTSQWRARAPLPKARCAIAVGVIGGRIYAAGGEGMRPAGAPVPPGALARYESVADFAAYDPQADRWQELPPLATKRDHVFTAVIDGRLIMAGGRSRPVLDMALVEAFDPLTGVWSKGTPMPTGRSGGGSAVLGGKLYTFGGEGNLSREDGLFDEVEAYDPKTDSWLRFEAMPRPRHSISIAAAGEQIIIPGGFPQAGGLAVVAFVDAFTPD